MIPPTFSLHELAPSLLLLRGGRPFLGSYLQSIPPLLHYILLFLVFFAISLVFNQYFPLNFSWILPSQRHQRQVWLPFALQQSFTQACFLPSPGTLRGGTSLTRRNLSGAARLDLEKNTLGIMSNDGMHIYRKSTYFLHHMVSVYTYTTELPHYNVQ